MARSFLLVAVAQAALAVALALPAAADFGSCRFRLGSDIETLGFVVDRMASPNSFRIGSLADRRASRVFVKMPARTKPVFLVLQSRRGSVEWVLEPETVADIAAVWVVGAEGQAVTNLPDHIPLGFSIRSSGYGRDCPAPTNEDDLGRILNAEFGRRFARQFYNEYNQYCVGHTCRTDHDKVAPTVGVWARLFGSSKPTVPFVRSHPPRASGEIFQ